MWWLGELSARTTTDTTDTTDGEHWVCFLDDPEPIKLRALRFAVRLRQKGFRVLGHFKSVAVDQLHAGFKEMDMNIEARTWLVDVHATTALERLTPVFWFGVLALRGGGQGGVLICCLP